uniref:Uncharacterized protein LOC102807100 n=1 Tax=Saccoglossus kowalevskii TaxID=10224 RepID=A0ABM0M4P6_SACKO|nr:PREDICTED: uncharacterized protein LOC102807100 [Saccoglossus kowalevskii]
MNPSYPLPNPNIDLSSNPFAALLQPSTAGTAKSLEECMDESVESTLLSEADSEKINISEHGSEIELGVQAVATEKLEINNSIQKIFLITVDKDPPVTDQNMPHIVSIYLT